MMPHLWQVGSGRPLLMGAGRAPRFIPALSGLKSMGMNLEYAYDGHQPRFIDRARQTGNWLDEGYVTLASSHYDSNYNILTPASGETFVRRILHGPTVTGFGTTYNGRYRIWCESGDLSTTVASGGSNETVIDSQTIEVDLDWDGLIEINVTPGGSPPVNIHCVRLTEIALYNSGQHIDPVFLTEASTYFETARFMNWMGTNSLGSTYQPPVVDYVDYPTVDYQQWSERVPLEVIVDLCNRGNINPWICIPHQATDACVQSMAEYFRDNLNSSLEIRVEYSNEIWNSLFDQTAWCWDQSVADWGHAAATPRYTNPNWVDWAAKRAYECAQIFLTVFAGQTSRLKFITWGNFPTQSLVAGAWNTYDPGTYVNPISTWHEMTCNPYFGGGSLLRDNAAAIAAACGTSAAAGATEIESYAVASNTANLDRWTDELNTLASLNSTHGTSIVPNVYEYNQHIDPIQASDTVLYSGGQPIANFLEACEIATEGTVFQDEIDRTRNFFRTNNATTMCFHNDYQPWDQFGQWGAQNYIGENRSPWTRLRDWHAANPKWW